MRTARSIAAVLLVPFCFAALGCDDEKKEEHFCDTSLPVSSGYPSICDPEVGCPDAGVCGALSPTHDVGVCSIPCESDDDCAADIGCTGEGRCLLEDTVNGQMMCAYTCSAEADCPQQMTCTGYLGLNLCYPEEW
jgi:hypothetical protein